MVTIGGQESTARQSTPVGSTHAAMLGRGGFVLGGRVESLRQYCTLRHWLEIRTLCRPTTLFRLYAAFGAPQLDVQAMCVTETMLHANVDEPTPPLSDEFRGLGQERKEVEGKAKWGSAGWTDESMRSLLVSECAMLGTTTAEWKKGGWMYLGASSAEAWKRMRSEVSRVGLFFFWNAHLPSLQA